MSMASLLDRTNSRAFVSRASLKRARPEEDHEQAIIFRIAAALLMSSGAASAHNEPSQDTINAPTGLQTTTPDKPLVATVPEAATDAAGIPRQGATTGQAPNVSKKMGAEMDSSGDQRTAPDQE